jgi:hypothetical protein
MVTGRLRRRSWETPEGEAVGDRAEGRRRRRLAQGGSRPGRTQRPAGERRPHLGCPVPGLWRRISASSATAWLPSRGLNRPGFTGTVLCPWFRGAAWLDSHATVKAFSNSIGVSMPRLLWRRCRLWTTSRYSKMSSVTISSARPRPAIGSQRLRFTVPAGSGGAATVRARRPLPAGARRLQAPAPARRSVAGTGAVGARPAPCRSRGRVGRRCA